MLPFPIVKLVHLHVGTCRNIVKWGGREGGRGGGKEGEREGGREGERGGGGRERGREGREFV